jgi:hypothetical protein
MRKIITPVMLIVLLTVVACGQPDNHQPVSSSGSSVSIQQPNYTTTASPNVAALPAQPLPRSLATYNIVRSLKERVATASVIAVGQISDMDGVINGARDVNDINKAASDLYGVMQSYRFQVQRYLKGSGQDIIDVVQVEGMIDGDPALVTQADIDQAKKAYDYIPFRVGTTYLLFLDRQDYLHLERDYYGPAFGHPWRFIIASDGAPQLEVPEGALREMSPDFTSSLTLSQIEQLIQAE